MEDKLKQQLAEQDLILKRIRTRLIELHNKAENKEVKDLAQECIMISHSYLYEKKR